MRGEGGSTADFPKRFAHENSPTEVHANAGCRAAPPDHQRHSDASRDGSRDCSFERMKETVPQLILTHNQV